MESLNTSIQSIKHIISAQDITSRIELSPEIDDIQKAPSMSIDYRQYESQMTDNRAQ